jgi:enoyl-[acyl-carrier protein] reductase II
MTEEYLKLEKENVSYEKLHDLILGTSRKAPIDGDIEWGLVQAGQSLSVIKSIDSCEDIIQNIINEAEVTINNICSLI